jgi:hypothetical protein
LIDSHLRPRRRVPLYFLMGLVLVPARTSCPQQQSQAPHAFGWTWGEGVRAWRGAINKIGWGGGVNIMAAAEKKVKYRFTMFWVTHNIVLKLHPGQKSGHVVARASVAPVRLHCPICRKGINTLRIFAALEGDGGGVLLQYWHLGDLGAPRGGSNVVRKINIWRRQQDHKTSCGKK